MNISTYYDWCNVLDDIEKFEIGHSNEELMKICEKGTLQWVDGVAQRITVRIVELINNRIKQLNEFYNKRISMAFNSFDTTNLLIIFRKELIFLKRIASLSILPEDLKSNLVSEITNCAQKSQKSLDESAKRDLSGELKRIILSYRIDNI